MGVETPVLQVTGNLPGAWLGNLWTEVKFPQENNNSRGKRAELKIPKLGDVQMAKEEMD